jgi:hypothetical protein
VLTTEQPDDDRVVLTTRLLPKLLDAIGRGARAKDMSLSTWMRLAARDALRAQGIPQ